MLELYRLGRCLGTLLWLVVICGSLATTAVAQPTPAAKHKPTNLPGDPNTSGMVIVRLTELEITHGSMMIQLFRKKLGFPVRPEKAYRLLSTEVRSNSIEAVFENVPLGNYAVAVCHDTNDNGVCDTTPFGIPTEGVGVSNNAKGIMGPPKFKDARFRLAEKEMVLTIKLNYPPAAKDNNEE